LEKETFDAVLMDVQMPEMDGFEATAALRAKEQQTGAHQLVIAMTAHAMKGDREKCLAMGMDGYVSKPLHPKELFEVVERLSPAAVPKRPAEAPARPGDKIFNLAAALERTAGDRELLQELAAVFCAECPQMMAEVRSALDQNDARKLKDAAHALKGAVGVFGLSQAADAAHQLEMIGRNGSLAGGESIYQQLSEEIDSFLPALAGLARGESL
jgi:two-component system sensor histidine kinase/response regulator